MCGFSVNWKSQQQQQQQKRFNIYQNYIYVECQRKNSVAKSPEPKHFDKNRERNNNEIVAENCIVPPTGFSIFHFMIDRHHFNGQSNERKHHEIKLRCNKDRAGMC